MVKDSNCRFSITMDRELHADLAMIALETQMSISALISLAMTEFVARWKELDENESSD